MLRGFIFKKILKNDDSLHFYAWVKREEYGVVHFEDISLSFTTVVIARVMFYFMLFPLLFFVSSLVIHVVFLILFYAVLNDSKIAVSATYIVNSFIWFLILFWKGLKVLEEEEYKEF
jgi:hypothetical protein